MLRLWPIGLGVLGAIAIFSFGYHQRDLAYQRDLAKATALFEQRIKEASDAYARQKADDDAELALLQKLVDATPANPTIAIKKDMAERIGAVR
jgi:type II secretory pathway pseudopilin PulG